MKKLLEEFKTFALKGNVLDMAVGVVVGGAFTSIVNSLVADVLTPIISLVTPGMDFSAWHIGPIMVGNFINAVVSFVILAACVFAIVKAMNALMRKKEDAPAPPPAPRIACASARTARPARARACSQVLFPARGPPVSMRAPSRRKAGRNAARPVFPPTTNADSSPRRSCAMRESAPGPWT